MPIIVPGLVPVWDEGLDVGAGFLLARPPELRDAEVEDLDEAVPRHEQVLGLEVAVDDASLVRGRKAAHDLDGIVNGLASPQRARGQPIPERLSLEQLRHDVGSAVVPPSVVDGDDVGVVECAGGLGLVLEAPQPLDVLRDVGAHHLERDLARQALVAGAVDLAHAALAQQGEHLVRPDASARRETRRSAHRLVSRASLAQKIRASGSALTGTATSGTGR